MKTKIQLQNFCTILVFIIGIFFSSCRKETKFVDDPLQNLKNDKTNSVSKDLCNYEQGKIVLGQQKNNPYTLSVMQIAYKNVTTNGYKSLYPIKIRETHYYVRYNPKTWEEYNDLKEDSIVQFSDLPFDYNIAVSGNEYHDPSINDTLPSYQYATLKNGQEVNTTVTKQILSPLYVPEEDLNLLGSDNENQLFVEALLNEAYRLTGNTDEIIDLSTIQNTQTAKYTPSGNIQLFDTRLRSTYGMEGVKVTARRWFIIYEANSDFLGNYRMAHRFTRPCNYAAWFEYKRFRVHSDKTGTSHWINGPKQSGDWNHTIQDGYDRFIGHIFRAAYRYHYKEIGGLDRPFRWLWKKTYYIGKDKVGTGVNPIWINNIKIWRFNKLGEYGSDDIFSTTCHETGHTSHAIRMNTIIQFWQVDRKLQESWAVAIEWFLTHIEYVDRGIPNYGQFNYHDPPFPFYPNDYAYQYWNIGDFDGWYTPIYIDIIDTHNENGVLYPDRPNGSINDQVKDYTLSEIEGKMLKHIYGTKSLLAQLKYNKPVSITDTQIDLLLSFF